jgi:hypothetical protein
MRYFPFIILVLFLSFFLLSCSSLPASESSEFSENLSSRAKGQQKSLSEIKNLSELTEFSYCDDIDDVEMLEACLLLVSAHQNNFNLCDTFTLPESIDACIFAQLSASTQVDVDLCGKISANDLRNTCFTAAAYQQRKPSVCFLAEDEYKDVCLHSLAELLNDTTLCKEITTKRIRYECDASLIPVVQSAPSQDEIELTPCPIIEGSIKDTQTLSSPGFFYRLETGEWVGPQEYYFDEELQRPEKFLCYDTDQQAIGMHVFWDEFFMIALTEYKDGKKHGMDLRFEDGYVTKATTWSEGVQSGPAYYYFKDEPRGLQYQGELLDGKEVGVWTVYDKDGVLIEEREYS